MRPGAARAHRRRARWSSITKTNRRDDDPPAGRMDYIGVARVARGRQHDRRAAADRPVHRPRPTPSRRGTIPIVRAQARARSRAGRICSPGSHDYKAVVALFDSFPKDELFAAPAQELRHGHGAAGVAGRPRRCGCSCARRGAPQRLRDRRAAARPRLHRACGHASSTCSRRASAARSVDHHLSADSDPARFHFTVHVPEGALPDVDAGRAGAGGGRRRPRSWDDRLADALVERARASATGTSWPAATRARFPDYYKSAPRDLPGGVRRRSSSSSWAPDRPFVVGAAERARHGRAADPAEALQDRRQGAADRPAAAARAARPDGGRGGADAAPGRRRRGGRYLHDFGVLGPGRRAARPRPSWASLVADTVGAVWDGRAELGLAEPAGDRRRPGLAAGDDPARLPGVPPAARRAVHRAATRTTAWCETRHRPPAGGALRGAVRPTRADQDERAARARRRRSSPTSTASPASTTTASCAATWALIEATVRTNAYSAAATPTTSSFKFALRRRAGDAQAGAALGDLRLLAGDGGRPPARRLRRPRRHPLVRPPRGLPHRDPRPDEGADGQERGHRAGRRQGRLHRSSTRRPTGTS